MRTLTSVLATACVLTCAASALGQGWMARPPKVTPPGAPSETNNPHETYSDCFRSDIPLVGHTAASVDYGDMNWVSNYGNCRAFDPYLAGASEFRLDNRELAIADPTVFVDDSGCGPVFYLTGTCDDYGMTNFAIYKSTDLQHWSFHMLAFKQDLLTYTTAPTGECLPSGQTQYYLETHQTDSSVYHELRYLWSPQLFLYDGNVYLCFSAVDRDDEERLNASVVNAPRPAGPPASYDPAQAMTGYVVKMPLADFRVGNYHDTGGGSHTCKFFKSVYGAGSPSPQNNWKYEYTTGGGLIWHHDGGASTTKEIATSGFLTDLPSTAPGHPAAYSGWGLYHSGRSCDGTWIGDGLFTVFDHDNPDTAYLFYGWTRYGTSSDTGGNPSCYSNGHFIRGQVMYPTTPTIPDGASGFHSVYRSRAQCVGCDMPTGLDNGMSDLNRSHFTPVICNSPPTDPCNSCTSGTTSYPGGVAEGPSVYYNADNDRYYMFFSRNTFDSPDYQVVYRATNVGGAITDLNEEYGSCDCPTEVACGGGSCTRYERTLIRSASYNNGSGGGPYTNFANGEVFNAWGHPYIVVSCWSWCPARQDYFRTVYFKNLNFEKDGEISPLYDRPLNDSSRWDNVNVFLAPRAPRNLDVNGDGAISSTDVGEYINYYYAHPEGCP